MTFRQEMLGKLSSGKLVAILDRQRSVQAEYDATPERKQARSHDYAAVTSLIADIERELAARAAASHTTKGDPSDY